MVLVGYSDSEGSDAEPDTTSAPPISKAKKVGSKTGFQIDRSNSGKIRVAIPEIKPEHPSGEDTEDGPRKKARLGGGGLSGFNAFLPAPKRTLEKKAPVATTRKVFSLKTGAGPGFDRTADAEMKNDYAIEDLAGDAEDTTSAPGSSKANTGADAPAETMKPPAQVKLQGNPMMFRPLSVGRPQKKRKTTKIAEQPTPSSAAAPKPAQPLQQTPTPASASTPAPAPAPAPPKPKVSLFSLSSDEASSQPAPAPGPPATYQPLVYNADGEEASAADRILAESAPLVMEHSTATVSTNPTSSLDSIANDLNLSKAERRQLFGRNAMPSQSQVRTFNTDEEYASNQVLAQGELAGAQHNPVRAIAPGKHTLQQLLNVASSQKEALEESFATGRRNKKEAGSKYGW
ncbi:Mitotic checkpoint protein PRCC, C-terminal [Penicillium italicum]|uniref:Mitotic checkpoint protein PRCC, C-terminal n=1 Tax=Penicillium italicum TaxID=40296 RepID=A0A0A2LB83_PENIT|nr:Mitotic checkpoint protein PRCC, C-terminal [Penicillium italicum]